MGEWQPIETAPRDTNVLLFRPQCRDDKYGGVCLARYMTGRKGGGLVRVGWRVFHEPYYVSEIADSPTHWMPLPEPPIAIELCRWASGMVGTP